MGIIPAIAKIPARELSRRIVWLGAYIASIHSTARLENFPFERNALAKDTGEAAVKAYDEQFPQS